MSKLVLMALRKLDLDSMISAKRCPERDLVLAMIVQRLLDPSSKLATTRQWQSTTLAEELGVSGASEDDLYRAMDWLWERQERIEKKPAARHLQEGSLVLYDVSSSYYEAAPARWRSMAMIVTETKGCPSSSMA